MHRYSKLPVIPQIRRSTSVRAVPIERTDRSRHRVHNVRKRLGHDVVAQLVADYQEGVSTPALMEQYQLGKGTVLHLLQDHGIPMRHQHMTKAEATEAICLYQQGWSLARVGEHFNRNPSTIMGVLKRAGVERRKRWERG